MALNEKLQDLEATVARAVQELSVMNLKISKYEEALSDIKKDIKCLIKHTKIDNEYGCGSLNGWTQALEIIERHTGDIDNEALASKLRLMCATGICPSQREEKYLQEAADRLEEGEQDAE